MNIRVGNGFDVHAFARGRDLILGGVKIDYPLGLSGHSDADALLHAIIDSLLGPSNLGDIGTNFPDTDDCYRGVKSLELLRTVGEMLRDKGVDIINIDTVVVCQEPKIAGYVPSMKTIISETLGIPPERISIKGKTTENLGFTGRKEGIAAWSVALISCP